jgi:putative glutamine amidotransferase
MSKRPLIGITVDLCDEGDKYESPMAYAGAVEKAGGLPLLIPFRMDLSIIPELVDRLAGIVFSGGHDLDPGLYGQSWHPKAEHIDPVRQRFELALMAEVEKRRLPTLGICLGSQLMNVYRGGSLHQFLPEVERPSAIEHRKLDAVARRHPTKLDERSALGRAIGKAEISVNSHHKQAADRLGGGLRVVATAADGIIEGFEDPSFPLFAAVQWHPERLADEPEHLAPFKLLVETARSR